MSLADWILTLSMILFIVANDLKFIQDGWTGEEGGQ